jgi:predicted Zn finger-like uncharacterized protein
LILECPGCKSRLKIDPAKLPSGAGAAVCPKCKSRVLLPGTTATEHLTVQCKSCSARLKVNISRLKPIPSKSKCPKCSSAVELPAAPPGARPVAPPPPAPAAEPPEQEAHTRQLDARELGMLLNPPAGGVPGQPGQSAPELSSPSGSSATPIRMDQGSQKAGTFEQSAPDLSALIDEKVNALDGTPSEGSPAISQAPATVQPQAPAPMPSASASGDSMMPGASSPEIAVDLGEQTTVPPPDRSEGLPSASDASSPAAIPMASPKPAVARSVSGSRAVAGSGSAARRRSQSGPRGSSISRSSGPNLGAAIRAGSGKKSSPATVLLIGGVVSGSLIGVAILFLAPMLPPAFRPGMPEAITGALGSALTVVLFTVALSALGGLLGGIALPPAEDERSGSRISVFRCTVATTMLGILAGVGFALVPGPFDIMQVISWSAAFLLAGVITSLIGMLLGKR